MRNIIFLDLDGCMLSYRPELYFEKVHYGVNEVVLDIFLKIISNTFYPTNIVLISTVCIQQDEATWLARYPLLRQKLLPYLDPIDKRISPKYIATDRVSGILNWIQKYDVDGINPIVIDDSWLEYVEKPLQEYPLKVIPCRTSLGMTYRELRLLELYLKPTLTIEQKRYIVEFPNEFSPNRTGDAKLEIFWKSEIVPNL